MSQVSKNIWDSPLPSKAPNQQRMAPDIRAVIELTLDPVAPIAACSSLACFISETKMGPVAAGPGLGQMGQLPFRIMR